MEVGNKEGIGRRGGGEARGGWGRGLHPAVSALVVMH